MQDVAVFISYRRSDASPDAGRLYDALRRRYSRDSLFMDVDSLRPGQDWIEAIDRAVSRADVFLALIGATWLDARDEKGNRRLDNELDPVRLEIEAAIRQDKRIIPVLFGSARMPTADELPASMLPLVRHHAIFISHSTFESDMRPLFAALRTIGEQKAAAEGAPIVAAALPRARKPTADQRAAAPPPQKSRGGFSGGLVAGAGAVLVAIVVLAKFGLDMVAATSPAAMPSPSATLIAVGPTPTTKPSITPTPTPMPTPTAVPSPHSAEMTSPTSGSVLPGSDVTFTWSGATGGQLKYYGMYIGSSSPDAPCPSNQECSEQQGSSASAAFDLYLMPTGKQTSQSVTGLPTDGSKIYVRLFTKFEPDTGAYIWRDYVFTAAGS